MYHQQATATLLEATGKAIRWDQQGMPGNSRGRGHSVPSAFRVQTVQGGPRLLGNAMQRSDLAELKEILKSQQKQLNQLT